MTELCDLTARQLAVASLVARSYTNKTIANELGISVGRVRVLVSSIAFRIGADCSMDERVQVALWWQARIVQTDPDKIPAMTTAE